MDSASLNKRRERDIMKLMMSNHEVALIDEEKKHDFHVIFHGPKDSHYEGVKFFIKKFSFQNL